MKKVLLILLILCWTGIAMSAVSGVNVRAEQFKNQKDIIVFTFSKPIKEQNRGTSFSNKPLVRCDGTSGSFEFVSSRQLYYYLTAPLVPGKSLECSMNKPYFKSVHFQQESVIVRPEPFMVESISMVSGGKSPIFRLSFNDDVHVEELKKHLVIKDIKQGEPDTLLNYQVASSKMSDVFLITLNTHNPNVSMRVLLGRLQSVHGVMLKKKYTHQLPSGEIVPEETIVNKPGMYSFSAESVSTNDGKIRLRLFMDDVKYWEKVTNQNINRFIKTTPSIDFVVQNNGYQYFYEDGKDRKYIDLIGDFEALTHYQIQLKRGLKTSKLVLKKDKILSVTTGARSPYMEMVVKKPYVSNKKSSVELSSTNVGKVKVKVEQLLEQNYRYFVNFSNKASQQFHKYAEVILEKELSLENPSDQFITNNFELSRVMPKSKSGVFRISFVHHYSKINSTGRKEKRTLRTSQMVYSSDLGIMAKLSRDQLFVSVLSLSKNTPIPSAKITVYSENNTILATGVSDKKGIYTLNQKGFSSLRPHSVLVHSQDDRNFLMLTNRLSGGDPTETIQVEDRYRMISYMSRKLLRPGDKTAILFILKDANYQSISDFPVLITLTDPEGLERFAKVVHTNSNGLYEMLLDIPYEYKTGKYRLTMKIGGRIIGKGSFQVEEFIPNRIETNIAANKSIYIGNEPVIVSLASQYLFGAPAKALNTEVRFSAVSQSYQNDQYKSYSFTTDVELKESEKDFINIVKNSRLDEKGKASLVFKNRSQLKPPSILKGMISAKVFDEGRPVAAYADVTIYPYQRMVGIKRQHDGMTASGSSVKFQTVLLNMKNQSPVAGKLKVTVKKQSWFRTYDRNSSWGYRWYKDYQQVQAFVKSAGEPFSLSLQESGTYLVSVMDIKGLHTSTTIHQVSGWSFDPVSPRDDMRNLDIKTDHRVVKSGDNIPIQITSPITGRLLLTVEKDQVLQHYSYDMPNNSASIQLPVPNMEANGFYITGVVTRNTEKDDPLLPFRTFGNLYIGLDKSEHRIDVNVSAPDEVEPEQPFQVSISSNAKAGSQVAVSIVDLGILQIISQKLPKLFDAFMRKPQLKVGTFDFYDDLNSHSVNGAVINVGGDGVSAMKMNRMQKFLSNKSIHKRVKPLSYWSGLATVDKNGRADISVRLPSFNGKAVLSAVVVGKNNIGTVTKDILIREKVIIKPTYPRFVRVGDRLKIPVRVFNKAESDIKLNISIQSSPSIQTEQVPKHILLKKDENQVFDFFMIPTDAGSGSVTIKVNDGTKQYQQVIHLPIKEKGALVSRSYTGESSRPVKIKLDGNFYREKKSKAYVHIADSYLARYHGVFNRLVAYPYGCAEQRSSKILALLNMVPFIDDQDAASRSLLEQRHSFLTDGINGLLNLQRYSGEFNYWENGFSTNPYASVFAIDALLTATLHGFDVPEMAIEKSIRFLKRNINHKAYQNTIIPYYSGLLLSEQNKVKASTLNALFDRKKYQNKFLSTVMMAAMLKNKGNVAASKKVLEQIRSYNVNQLPDTRFHGEDFYSRGRDLAFGLWLYTRYFGKDDVAESWMRTLTRWFENTQYMSTQESAFMIRALNSFYNGASPEPLDVHVLMNEIQTHVVKKMSMSDILSSDVIGISSGKAGTPFNYAVEVTGFVEKPIGLEKSKNKGIRVSTMLYEENGEEVDPEAINQGDLLYAKVDLRSKSKIENIVISYELPSCLEPVNLRLDQLVKNDSFKDYQVKLNYRDIRDDKILSFVTLNKHAVFYLPVRAVTAGSCIVPAITTEAMYAPELNDFDREYFKIKVIEMD